MEGAREFYFFYTNEYTYLLQKIQVRSTCIYALCDQYAKKNHFIKKNRGKNYLFISLAALGLSCSVWDPRSSLWRVGSLAVVWEIYYSFLTRD